MRRTACTACGGDLQDFLDLGSSPLADKFPENLGVTEQWYPLVAAVCKRCWLMQLREVVDDSELYGEDYGFRTASSPAAVDYFRHLAAKLVTGYTEQAKKLTVEIACNDGTMLKYFAEQGCNVLGIEPSGAWNDITDITVIPKPFTGMTPLRIDKCGAAGLVIACNVIAHVADPRDFLDGIRRLLAKDGIAVVEFQDAAALIAGCQYDHVYHEHRQFFSLASFSRMVTGSGLEIFNWERTPAQGGSIRVYLRRGKAHSTVVLDPWLEKMTPYEGMQERAEYSRKRLNTLIGEELNKSHTIAGYGASAKSCTLFCFCEIGPQEVRWVEDLTPEKIGKLTPGSKISIRSPTVRKNDAGTMSPYGTRPNTYLLTSWNYAASMIRDETQFLASGGKIIIPGAVPVII